MKTYLLSIYHPEGGTLPPDQLAIVMRDVQRMRDELKAQGNWVFGGGLHPSSTATVVRAAGDEMLITDGPFVEAKEHIGGITILKATDLDAALEWGRRLARATNVPIEVRPFRGDGADS